jgi:phosphate transport system protein
MRDRSIEGHTVRRYDGELNQLHLLGLEMGGLAHNQLQESLRAMRDLNVDQAQRVIGAEPGIDALESDLDERVISLAARRAPLGRDLRLVLVVSKCVTEFEGIGDEAAHIAENTLHLVAEDGMKPGRRLIQEIARIGEHSVKLSAGALKAYDLLDEGAANDVISNHRTSELHFEDEMRRLVTSAAKDPRTVGQMMEFALAARSLKAIGRHAKKIAGQVIFFLRGDDIRHSNG